MKYLRALFWLCVAVGAAAVALAVAGCSGVPKPWEGRFYHVQTNPVPVVGMLTTVSERASGPDSNGVVVTVWSTNVVAAAKVAGDAAGLAGPWGRECQRGTAFALRDVREPLDHSTETILAAGERRQDELSQRLDELDANIPRLDERTKEPVAVREGDAGCRRLLMSRARRGVHKLIDCVGALSKIVGGEAAAWAPGT